jgi:hypothetical protein
MENLDLGSLVLVDEWITNTLMFRVESAVLDSVRASRLTPQARLALQTDVQQRRIEARRAEHAARTASRRLDTLLQRRRPDAIFVLRLAIPEAAPRGLSAPVVESRTTKETVTEQLASTGEQCTVCLEQLEKDQPARRLGCSHIYHVGCIDRWFERGTRCPNCNTEV